MTGEECAPTPLPERAHEPLALGDIQQFKPLAFTTSTMASRTLPQQRESGPSRPYRRTLPPRLASGSRMRTALGLWEGGCGAEGRLRRVNSLVGAWRLLSTEPRTEGGEVLRKSPPGAVGYIVYTADRPNKPRRYSTCSAP